MTDSWVAATEEPAIMRGGYTKAVVVNTGERLFRVSDELAARSLLDWSEPLQLKLEQDPDGVYMLVARTVAA